MSDKKRNVYGYEKLVKNSRERWEKKLCEPDNENQLLTQRQMEAKVVGSKSKKDEMLNII